MQLGNYKKPKSKKLDIFILSIELLSKISKTMIFVYNINKKIALKEYLYIKFLENLKNKTN